MEKDHQYFQYLLKRYADHQISREEYDLLLAYVGEYGIDAALEAVMDRDWESMGMDFPIADLRSEKLFRRIATDIKFDRATEKAKNIRLWSRIAGTAAAIAAIVFGIWFLNYRNGEILKQVQDDVVVNDINPGKNTATLTLADGKTVTLSNAKTGVVVGTGLKYNDGSLVQSGGVSLDIPGAKEQLTATTPRGGTYQVTLPDGTRVWLNAASKISFPAQFSRGARKIQLSGEAYFEVASSYTALRGRRMKQSFIVESKGQTVEVLGTHFNINAYDDEVTVRTTLLEGSVRITPLSASGGELPKGQRGGDVILKPNQQSVLYASSRLNVKDVDVSEALAWKNGLFVFNNEPLESIMRKLARWYDIDVVYRDIDKSQVFAGGISKYGSILKILAKMEKTGDIHFKIEGRRVIVTK